MAQPSESEFQLACPVCSAFNPADFAFARTAVTGWGHQIGSESPQRYVASS